MWATSVETLAVPYQPSTWYVCKICTFAQRRVGMCPSPLSVLDSRPKGAQEGQKLLALADYSGSK
ncbi:uncharacterized protein MRET_2659 [Malassezia restricta]|uniref:uncharacterized protein n=1 Tax=Malassezia restricta TaxID=76775 RepID=UPI000DD1478D|nr:uncharacterized protein MRET_2659 [Malassezia restricta]AXA50861.1 uncharacterized protein MRET_2659 [Malassezia restricta]